MRRPFILLTLVIGMLLLGACGTEQPPPSLTSEQKNLAIQVIKEYPEVRDAAVGQDGKELSLVVIVDYATSIERVKNLGDNFVRLVKTYGPEPSPGKEIGKGLFDYLIGVYYPNEKLAAMGAKASFSDHISW